MPEYKVTSEIYSEFDYKTAKTPMKHGSELKWYFIYYLSLWQNTIFTDVVSDFSFTNPSVKSQCDEDGDLIIDRNNTDAIQIEHSISTALQLVGLQVWRGALLLADLAIHWGRSGRLKETNILELGAGTGLSSFVAAMYAKKVICTGSYNTFYNSIIMCLK